MTPNVYACRELLERELEQMTDNLPDEPNQLLMIVPVYTMLSFALDMLNKAIAFDDTPTRREVIP